MSSQDTARGTKTYRRSTYPAIDPTQPELSTKGKSAVVTARGRASGRAADSVGGAIAELAPDTKVFTYVVDIVDEDAVKAAFAAFAAKLGGRAIDVLVANAGYMANLATIADADPSDWWSGFEINIKSNFHLMPAYVQHAPTDGSGAVIHVSMSSVHWPYMPDFSSYRASKAGATKLFELFARENPALFVLQVHRPHWRHDHALQVRAHDRGAAVR
ncbi:hypothetical protein DL767_010472 [Monosporascus sp. MG133]|nr:hypothetical protein DL767_010472 [Monosporascus sp. MG133]